MLDATATLGLSAAVEDGADRPWTPGGAVTTALRRRHRDPRRVARRGSRWLKGQSTITASHSWLSAFVSVVCTSCAPAFALGTESSLPLFTFLIL